MFLVFVCLEFSFLKTRSCWISFGGVELDNLMIQNPEFQAGNLDPVTSIMFLPRGSIS